VVEGVLYSRKPITFHQLTLKMAAPTVWQPSSPPPEEWEGEEARREGRLDGVVGEEIDAFNQKHYEVRWVGWRRKDNTNSTWLANVPMDGFIQDDWNEYQESKRAAGAKESLSMKIPLEPGQLWHQDATVEIARGYHEKIEEGRRIGLQRYANWDSLPRLTEGDSGESSSASSREHSSRPAQRRARSLRSATSDLARSTTTSSAQSEEPNEGRRLRSHGKPVSRQQKPASHNARHIVSVHSETSYVESPRYMESHSESRRGVVQSGSSSSSEDNVGVEGRRNRLQSKWMLEAMRSGAAKVTIANNVNSEPIPPGLDDFHYCEHHYIRARDIPSPLGMVGYMVSCECDRICHTVGTCGCQDASELKNDSGEKQFAYTTQKLFKFNVPRGVEVIECNEKCSCSRRRCPNRVAQRPRDVPIEVFRTPDRGWGVRATVDLVRGKVVGIFTGEIITREQAHKYTGDRKSYIFDLDVHEASDDGENAEGKFSVDAYKYGNWSRFINHSCEPNMSVFPVIWDSIPEFNQPHLAFVATRAIPASTELTIDYAPGFAAELQSGRIKGKNRIPHGAELCMCGSDSCRGWVRV